MDIRGRSFFTTLWASLRPLNFSARPPVPFAHSSTSVPPWRSCVCGRRPAAVLATDWQFGCLQLL